MERFYKNSQRILAVDYFVKRSTLDVWQGSKYVFEENPLSVFNLYN